jgi:hypothetical protein
MPIAQRSRPRREKVFGTGRPLPLDRNAKARVMTKARAMKRRTAKGRHYGQLTAKALDVLEALLWGFHNARSGLCFPSLESIAEKAACARSTVAEAIKALERCGLLTWCNRLKRVREIVVGLFGEAVGRVRVLRTSNAYRFNDPSPGKVLSPKAGHETQIKDISPSPKEPSEPTPLDAALARWGRAVAQGGF